MKSTLTTAEYNQAILLEEVIALAGEDAEKGVFMVWSEFRDYVLKYYSDIIGDTSLLGLYVLYSDTAGADEA